MMNIRWKLHLSWCLFAAFTGLAAFVAGGAGAATPETHVYEMRTYYPAEGKMEALHARFRDHTIRLFEKHGMHSVGYWVPVDQEADGHVLIYVLRHPSQEAAEEHWKQFREDPAWQQAKAESETAGALVEKVEAVFLSPTEYSQLQ